ncbi:MAG: hypothetical protein IPN54_05505 [Bacteroidetes bacterium]|nr:hypothetical protein [Bacteroidota bacterium]
MQDSLYIWGDGSTDSTFSVTASGIYSVVVTDAFGCSATDTVAIQIDLIPVVDLGVDTTLCFGSTYQLTAPAGYPGYLWTTGEVTETIVVNTTGIYDVVVTTPAGCTAVDTVQVTINPRADHFSWSGCDCLFSCYNCARSRYRICLFMYGQMVQLIQPLPLLSVVITVYW